MYVYFGKTGIILNNYYEFSIIVIKYLTWLVKAIKLNIKKDPFFKN